MYTRNLFPATRSHSLYGSGNWMLIFVSFGKMFPFNANFPSESSSSNVNKKIIMIIITVIIFIITTTKIHLLLVELISLFLVWLYKCLLMCFMIIVIVIAWLSGCLCWLISVSIGPYICVNVLLWFNIDKCIVSMNFLVLQKSCSFAAGHLRTWRGKEGN